ncbi:MAG: Re/Si-specific NAD(P)(+) transhydrogenase subunit alpha [Planctomycetota bacterium]
MQIGVPKETDPVETRVAMTPDVAAKLVKKGAGVAIQGGLGAGCNWADSDYSRAGATVTIDREALLSESDVLLRIQKPPIDELATMGKNTIHISYLDPFNEQDLVESLRNAGISAISMEMVPRTTRAQKMDALSSQHSLAGYYMVVLAAERIDKVLPMMTTPSGTIQPARVFVIGAGVAGLQAIATAKRLGARVEAFDTRPVVKEQVESLGARFLEIDLGETGESEQGYAKELTEEQKKMQQAGMAKACQTADIVITTAQLFGRPAPTVVTRSMVQNMRPGSIIVDYAVESGGNVEGSRPGEDVDIGGVRIIGMRNYPGQLAIDASRMYANNLYNMLAHFWDDETSTVKLDRNDEIVSGCLITHQGELVNEMIRKAYGAQGVEA